MTREKPVLFIERLSVFTALVALSSSYRYSQIFFVHETGTIKGARARFPAIDARITAAFTKLDNVDFLGMFYDYMEEACEHCNERIYEQSSSNTYAHTALDFCGDPGFSVVLKKELLNRYVQFRAKTYLILKKNAERYDRTVFFPQDNVDIASTFSTPFRTEDICHVPAFIRVINFLKYGVRSAVFLLVFPILLVGVTVKIAAKGFILRTPVPQKFRYAIDMQKNGLINERGLDLETSKFFLYNDDDFSPQKLLHMVRLGHRLDADAREVFVKYNCPYIELDTIRVPAGFFVTRVLGNLVLDSVLRELRFLISQNRNPVYVMPALAAMKMLLEEEIVNLHYSAKVFISRDDYSPYHIVRTLVARRRGNRTAGFQWADYYNHNSTFSHLLYDRYAVWGEFYAEFHKRALAGSTPVVIGAGIYGSDTMYELKKAGWYPEKYRAIKEKQFIIGIMGSAFEPETSVTKGPAARFHDDVIELTDKYENVFRILKPKTDWQDDHLNELMKNRSNLVLERELTTPRFILVPDLIIVMSNSSVGMEALMTGAKVVYYSFVTPEPHQKIAAHSRKMVAFTREELAAILDRIILEGKYEDDAVVDRIRYKFGYKFDGQVSERLRGICRELAAE
jgi:hypothetical protein